MVEHPRHAELTKRVPAAVRTAIARALGATGLEAEEAAHAALDAAGLERGPGLGAMEDLTPVQRATLELLAFAEITIVTHVVPVHAEGRQRALGLVKAGPLERVVALDGARVPLWLALDRLRDDPNRMRALVKGLELPILERLALYAEIERNPYGYAHGVGVFFPWGEARELDDPKVARWASRTVASLARGVGWYGRVGKDFRAVLFEALVAGGVTLAAEWDRLLPVHFEIAATKRVLAAIPEARRGAAAVQMLDWHTSGGKVAGGLAILAHFPSKELVELVVAHAAAVDDTPKRETMKRLEALAKKSSVVRAALGPTAPRPALRLRVAKTIRPKRPEDLTALQAEQLVVAGKWYDGKGWSAAVRLGAEVPKGRSPARFDGSFAGFLEVREIADQTKAPAFTALLYMVDAGTVFRAGTTEVVASIVQSRLETVGAHQGDGALHDALQVVLKPRKARRRA